MYLIIDNSTDGKVTLHYTLNTKWVQRDFLFGLAGNALAAIDEILSAEKKTLSDLKGIGVVVGLGRFTSTRVAVTVANTLAYAMKIPVAGVTKIDYQDFDSIIQQTPVGQYVSAKYSGEAHIGKSKFKNQNAKFR